MYLVALNVFSYQNIFITSENTTFCSTQTQNVRSILPNPLCCYSAWVRLSAVVVLWFMYLSISIWDLGSVWLESILGWDISDESKITWEEDSVLLEADAMSLGE